MDQIFNKMCKLFKERCFSESSCPGDQFSCPGGGCATKCNGVLECSGGQDEDNCEGTLYLMYFNS